MLLLSHFDHRSVRGALHQVNAVLTVALVDVSVAGSADGPAASTPESPAPFSRLVLVYFISSDVLAVEEKFEEYPCFHRYEDRE